MGCLCACIRSVCENGRDKRCQYVNWDRAMLANVGRYVERDGKTGRERRDLKVVCSEGIVRSSFVAARVIELERGTSTGQDRNKLEWDRAGSNANVRSKVSKQTSTDDLMEGIRDVKSVCTIKMDNQNDRERETVKAGVCDLKPG